MAKVSIFVVYHKQAELFRTDNFLPINAGRAVCDETQKAWLTKNTLADDTGDNISLKNPSYNELTAVYWAWKNYESDYYGLMHYRRHFVFEQRKKAYYSISKVKENYFDSINYSSEKLQDLLNEYDFIAPMPMTRKSVYEHYKNAHDVADLEFAMKVIKEKYPEYAASCDKYVYGRDSYFYNMFVFDKPTFFRYCEFVFGVLGECEKRFDGKRMFISERLTGIFITQLISEEKKGLFLPTMYIVHKPTLKAACKDTKKNLSDRKKYGNIGIKSMIYAFKPLLTVFIPEFIFRLYRNKK